MFKKKGGPAFKPKLPSARPRPAGAAAAAAGRDTSTPQPSASTGQPSTTTPSDATIPPIIPPPTPAESVVPSIPDKVQQSPSRRRPIPTPPSPAATQKTGIELSESTSISTSTTNPIASTIQLTPPATQEASAHKQPVRTSPRKPQPTVSQVTPSGSLPIDPLLVPSAASSSSVTTTATPAITITQPRVDVNTANGTLPETTLQESAPLPTQEQSATTRKKPVARKGAANNATQDGTTIAEGSAAAPKRRARKQPPATETGNEDGTTPAPKRPRKRKTADSTANEGEGSGTQQTAEAPPKKRRTRKSAGPDQEGDGTATSVRRQSQRRRARSETPEDAENQVVDLQALKMADLTKDLHIGKKFSRHDELRDREREKRNKQRQKKALQSEGGGGIEGDSLGADQDQQTANSTRDGSVEGEESSKKEPGTMSRADTGASNSGLAPSGPQYQIIDGQIVVDQTSLVMDRHARAAAAGEDLEEIEENDFTRLITSNSYKTGSKLRGPNYWSADETELFYRGLGMFGTSFEMISKMFPGKHRRHIKMKFNREERHAPARITATLTGEKALKIDMDEYKALSGLEFESVSDIMAEQERIQAEHDAEIKRIADEQAETMRKKKEELFRDDENNGNNGSDHDSGLPGKGRKGRKKSARADQGSFFA